MVYLSPSDLHWAALELFDAYAGKGERVFKSISAVEDVSAPVKISGVPIALDRRSAKQLPTHDDHSARLSRVRRAVLPSSLPCHARLQSPP